MAAWKRWLGWVFRVGLLIAAGYFSFHYARSQPRCVIVSDRHILLLSDDGEWVVTGCTGIRVGWPRTNTELHPPVRVWNTRTGAMVRELLTDAPAAGPITHRLNGSLIAAYSGDATIRLANWRTGREWSITTPEAQVVSVDLSPDGRFLSLHLADKDQERVLIDAADGKVAWSGNHEYVAPMFSEDGKTAYLYNRTRLERWDADMRRIEKSCPIEPPLHFDRAMQVFAYWSSNEQCIVVGDCATLTTKARLRPGFLRSARGERHSAKYVENCLRLQFSPGGRWAASMPGHPSMVQPTTVQGEFELWDTSTGRRVAAMRAYNPGFPWFPDAKTAYHGTLNDGDVLDSSTGRVKWHCASASGMWLLNHTTAVHLTAKAHFDILDPETGRARHMIPHPFTGPGECPMSFSKDQNVVVACGPRRESRLLAYWPKSLPAWPGAKATAVQVIDLPTGRVLHELTFNKHVGAEVSADGGTLVCFDWIPDAPAAETTYSLRFYDLDSKEPWLCAFAAPAALLAAWLLWRIYAARRCVAISR